MKSWFIVVVSLSALVVKSRSETCDQCTVTYEAAAEKTCVEFQAYMGCLETASPACSLPADKTTALDSAYDAVKDSCSVTETCKCQIQYWKSSSTTDAPAECSADKYFLACMKGKGGNSCAGRSRDVLMNSLQFEASCITADSACSCEKIYAETDITAETKCAADTAFMTCMVDKTGDSCTGQSPSQLVAGHNIDDDCPTSTCTCFIQYLERDITGNEKCLAQKGFISCMTGKTELQCDGVKKASDMSGFPAIDQTCVGDKATEACGCDHEYALADLTDPDLKCTADVTYMMCLKDKTTATCDGRSASEVASVHTIASTCLETLTDTCVCEIEQAKRDVNADKCGANEAFMTCLRKTTGASCSAAKTALEVVADAKTALTGCELSPTCDCEVQYAENDLSVAETKCQADKSLIHCVRSETSAGCVEDTTVSSLVDMVDEDTACVKSSLCQCEMTYTGGDKLTAPGHCSNARSLLSCTYDVGDTVTSCNGGSKADLLAFAKNLITSQIDNCKLTDTCECEELAKPGECSDLKSGITCLQTAVYLGCNGVKSVQSLATEIVSDIDDKGETCVTAESLCRCEMTYVTTNRTTAEQQCKADTDFFACVKTKTAASCSGQSLSQMVTAHAYEDDCPSGTCKCLVDYMKMDISESNKCEAQKGFISCMTGKTELQCDGVKKANDVSGFPVIDQACVGEKATDSCACEHEYIKADLTVEKCTADKTFLLCLKEKTTPSCNGTLPHILATNHPVDTQCWDAVSDTCKCEMQLIRDGVTEDRKCSSYLAFVSCLKTTTGQSCDGGKSAPQLITWVKPKLESCDLTPTCQCELSYAENSKKEDTDKCQANKALIACLRNEVSSGCVDSTTISSLVDIATQAVPGCDRSSLCQCEAEYTRGEKVNAAKHCRNAKSLLACLYDEADTVRTCSDGSKEDLETFAKTLISSNITDCSLDDTCRCEEDMLDGTCSKLKSGISCLKTATSKGCNGEKIVKTIADEINVKITALESCTLSTACRCELNYTRSNVNSDVSTCSAAKTLKTCLEKAESKTKGVKGCDKTTAVTKIVTDLADKVIEAKCCAVQSSLVSLLLLLGSLTTLRILTG